MDFKIEKNVPIPNKREGSITSVLSKLNIGDSFTASMRSRNGAYILARRMGFGIKTAIINDNEVRIWRIK